MAKRMLSDWEKQVRHAMIDRDMTVPELAESVGCNPTYLYDIFNGARKGLKYKEKINAYLGIKEE